MDPPLLTVVSYCAPSPTFHSGARGNCLPESDCTPNCGYLGSASAPSVNCASSQVTFASTLNALVTNQDDSSSTPRTSASAALRITTLLFSTSWTCRSV